MKRILFILLCIVWVLPMLADEYDPTVPPEPYIKYQVTTTANPDGYTSGGGLYISGTQIEIGTSSKSQNYTFNHWTKNGEYYSAQRSFTYTVEAQSTDFVAVYDYTPGNPSEPNYTNQYRLYLTNNISSACSFNKTSGSKIEADTWVTVTANSSSGYRFLGWFQNGTMISNTLSFNYLMPAENITLTAEFYYDPIVPSDPGSSADQDDIANTAVGDIDGSGTVNVSDAVDLITHYLNNTTDTLKKSVADVDNNGVVNVSDAIEIIQIYLNNRK